MNRLATLQRWLLYSSLGLLLATGGYWALLHYAGMPPWLSEPLLMKVHGAAAMAALVLVGGLLPAHVSIGWSLRRNRSSGIGLLVLCTLLALTGYLLYYLGGEEPREASSYIHLVLGIALPLVLAVHLVEDPSRQPAIASASQPRPNPQELTEWKTPTS